MKYSQSRISSIVFSRIFVVLEYYLRVADIGGMGVTSLKIFQVFDDTSSREYPILLNAKTLVVENTPFAIFLKY